MAGQIAEYGAAEIANHLAGQAVPVVSATAPTWAPGMYWIDSSSSYSVNAWDGAAWVVVSTSSPRYVALLTADPVASGAKLISDLSEVTTSGYARQAVTFGQITASGISYPSPVSNTNLITFGPVTAGMTTAAQWVALVTVASGTTGLFLNSWTLPTSVSLNASQSFQIGAGALTIEVQ